MLLMLLFLLLQSVSGLFNSDEIFFDGPFYFMANSDFRDAMGVLHNWAFNTLLALVAVHVLAVIYHQLWRKEKLLQAMVFGGRSLNAVVRNPVSLWRAVLIVAALALTLWGLIEAAPQPERLW